MTGTLPATARGRARDAIAALLLVLATATAVPGGRASVDVDRALSSAAGVVKVIVQGGGDALAHAVRRAGGVVTRVLPIVDGLAARVPAEALSTIARVAGVRSLSLDRRVRFAGNDSPGNTPNSVYAKSVRANDLWSSGYDGAGTTVALIDTGVAPVADLAGRILPVYDDLFGTWSPCVNLSGEPDCADSYGHGTFMAGIIAGNGAASDGKWKGVAPGANLISIKIAGRDGAADVSNVLSAIQWVVSFRDRYGIRVLNLSLGTDGTQSYRTDPLNYAVERAWAAGVVVVVSASNGGPDAGTIAKPGDDPWVITAGATDDRGTPGLGDDELPDFSSRGPTAADGLAKPDVAAPGAHIVSLRAPGSAIDEAFGSSTIDGAYRKGSGTSMSAAVVSGVAALIAQTDPGMSPDRMKHVIASTARPAAADDPMAVGSGVPDAKKAAFQAPPGVANQGLDRSSGLGTLDASRGTVRVQADDLPATIVGGTLTTQLLVFDPVGYTTGDWDGARWYASQWYGARWYGARWYGSTWTGARWYGARWYGETTGARWYGSELSGARWYGAWE